MLLSLFAQAAIAPPPFKEWGAALVVAVTPLVLVVLDWLFGQLSASIPVWLKPILVSIFSAGVTYLGGVVTSDILLLALIGLATAGLNELIQKLGERGTFGRAVKAHWTRSRLPV